MSDGGPPDRGRRPAWIETLAPEETGGALVEACDGIAGRSGSVAHILTCQKLTLRPSEVAESDLARLREAGLDDRGILEVVQVTSYFNFVNRLADGLGVSLEHPAG
jgi:hypothetical protein